MDLDMPVVDGLTATQRLGELACRAYVLILTASHGPEHAERAFEVGAIGYLTKDRVATELVPAILEVGALISGPADRLSADGGSELADQARV
jgi:two-component system, NarL family, response regulator DesR